MKTPSIFKSYFIFTLLYLVSIHVYSQDTEIQYLSGTDKDNTIDWEFWVSGGRNANQWSTIPVPSNWEMQGFGTYRYYSDWLPSHAPDSIGRYKKIFTVPSTWDTKKVVIKFGAVMTDTKVKVNGKSAGLMHQGGFYEFQYDITNLLNYGAENLIEVEVNRFSADHSINISERRTDFWQFSGIYRPVWLEAYPQQHIKRTAVNAKHTGDFSIDLYLENIKSASTAVGQITELDGTPVGSTFSIPLEIGQQKVTLSTKAENIKPWSAEWPNRYKVDIKLLENNKTLHQTSVKFGFRTIEVRKGDGVYINNVKTRFKGVNRHTAWPESGRTTSRDLSIVDVNLMKEMNMNAVRMSHYPPDSHFLDVTDSLGLYVIDELTGWQNKYDTIIGRKLVEELIVRDVNHPSIVLWANGNEGGWNTDLDKDFDIWDPQHRNVIHPWENFGDINTAHYEIYDCCPNTLFHGSDLFMPTEFLHGLYDGGHGAGLEDWWNLMLQNPLSVGGFLWVFADEGIVRDDQDDAIDVAGNRAPDGIVGPYREKEGSFYTIKKVWSPVYFEISEQNNLIDSFKGEMQVENRYDNTNLNQLSFSWQLVDFPSPGSKENGHFVIDKGTFTAPDISPGKKGVVAFDLPDNWKNRDALYITATDPYGREIYTWTWMIPEPAQKIKSLLVFDKKSKRIKVSEENGLITLKANNTEVQISNSTGLIANVKHDGKNVSLSNGPRLVSGESKVTKIEHRKEGNDYVVEISLEGNLRKINWRMLPSGWLKLEYSYHFKGGEALEYLGVTFDYPENMATGMKWLGKGPYRVWKNRLKGVEFNVWEKEYNNTITGISWNYPEFKGFHDNMYWATLQTKEAPITMITDTDNLFLRAFTPEKPKGEAFDPRLTDMDFPSGDISFLNGIAPIGTKFHRGDEHGPMGQPNNIPRLGKWFNVSMYFYFGTDFQLKDTKK